MSKYVPPHSRKAQEVSTQEAEKRRQRQLRFSKEGGNKNERNGRNSSHRGATDRATVPQYGFVSRGEDSRLQSSETAQREYFEWVLQTFEGDRGPEGNAEGNTGIGGNAGVADEKDSRKVHQKEKNLKEKNLKEKNASNGKTKGSIDKTTSSGSIDSTLAALRKLREAMLHQKPTQFSVKVHLFSVRVSAPVGHYQTYIPSINYLLASGLLSTDEVEEIATLLVLHVSHHNHQDEKAFRIFNQHLLRDKNSHLYSVLVAWTTGDYHNWLAKFNGECDHCIHAIMAGGLPKIMGHMVTCMTKSYFTLASREFEEKFLPKGMSPNDFMEKYAQQWKEEERRLVMRQRR